MERQHLVAKIARAWKRDQRLGISVAERLRKGAELLSETAAARIALRDCDAVGPGARLVGRARVVKRGRIEIGAGLVIRATYLPVELVAGEGAAITLGDGVWINFGSVVASASRVTIGHRVMIGQHCIISDVEVPEQALESGVNDARPIEIGEDVWLAGRVTVLPGVKIGAGAVITAGSVVSTDIPPGVVAGGSPARVLRQVRHGTNGAGPSAANGAAARSDAATGTGTSGTAPPTPPATPAVAPAGSSLLISDFTIDELADELRIGDANRPLEAKVAPFGQVSQTLMQPPPEGFSDFAVVWTRPEATCPSFGRVLAFEEVSEAELFADVDAFTALVLQAATRYRAIFVPTWVQPPWMRGLGTIDLGKRGVARTLLAMNLRLADNLAAASNVFVLSSDRWFAGAGRLGANPRGWYLGKIAVPRAVLGEAAADIRASMAGLSGGARKLLVLDLDDTVWGGIVGDVGWEALRLGGHDGIGEAFVDFQRAVKNLKRRGIVLGIVSKNEESVALEAIRSHPEMVLREDDFVGWKINWVDKAKNIADLASELNLGLQSVVFIDDNPVERARVREALPEVLVPEWPEDKLLYPSAFHKLRCFDAPALSQEDVERTRLYAEERNREKLQKSVGSIDEWLKSLGITVRAEPLTAVNLARATQLLNKTNQLNLSTRRMTEAELTAWARSPGHAFWAVSVADRFGDAGLTGLVGVERDGQDLRIVDYVLSCRVMGRKVEETMLHLATEWAGAQGAARVVARHLPTAKNKPCLTALEASGFASLGDGEFVWETAQRYALPEPVALDWRRE